MSLRLTLALMCAASAAWGSPAAKPAIDVGPDVPFAAAQIEVALRGRVAAAVDVPPTVHIVARAWGVEIQVASVHREVALDGRTGSDAARLVALAMLDLLEEPEISDDAPPAAPPPRSPSLELSAYGGAAMWTDTLASLGAGVVVPAGGHLIGIDASAGRLVSGDFQLTTATLRVAAVARSGALEARGGVVVAPLFVTEGDGDTTVLFGLGGSVGYRVGITDPVHLVMRAGADFFATRTEYTNMGVPAASTPWFAPWFALGIEVTP